MVGGSGLYIRAIFEGISPLPPGDPQVRDELQRRLEAEGLETLRHELEVLDPLRAQQLAPADKQRILRSLEVAMVTGRTLGEWIADQPFGAEVLPATKICLTLPRKRLFDRIESRVQRMVDYGWVEEVRNLLASGSPPETPAFQAIGYRQIIGFLQERLSLEAALFETVRATKRFAKRQMTWFRKEPGIHWLEAQSAEEKIPALLSMSF